DSSRNLTLTGNWFMRRAAVSQSMQLSWAPQRAAGAPDTMQMGDIQTAWASDTPDGRKEWLELSYAQRVVPQIIRIHETNAPGALTRVTVFDSSGQEIEAWAGLDPARPNDKGIYVADVEVSNLPPTSRIRLYLDSPRVQGWNEIDAVGLVDSGGSVHWASSARASSPYAAGGTPTPPMTLAEWDDAVPGWASIARGSGNFTYE